MKGARMIATTDASTHRTHLRRLRARSGSTRARQAPRLMGAANEVVQNPSIRHRLLAAGTAVVALASGCAERSPSAAAGGSGSSVPGGSSGPAFVRYSDASEGFSISYPATWTKGKSSAGVAFLSPLQGSSDDFQENVLVAVGDVPAGMTLDEYDREGLEVIRTTLTDFQLEGSRHVSLDGHPGFEHRYVTRTEAGPVEGLQVVTLVGTKSYIVVYIGEPGEGFSTLLPTAREIISTFAID